LLGALVVDQHCKGAYWRQCVHAYDHESWWTHVHRPTYKASDFQNFETSS